MEEKDRRITPEKVKTILKKNGFHVSHEEAIAILEFMFQLAEAAVKQSRKVSENENG